MIQIHVHIQGELRACGCGAQPRHYECRGPSAHFLECSPCRVRTAKYPSFQEAVAAWEDGIIESFLARRTA